MYNPRGSSLFPWLGGKRLLARTILAEFPPHKTYYGIEGYYGKDIFNRSDYTVLKDLLAATKSKFVMSINQIWGISDEGGVS